MSLAAALRRSFDRRLARYRAAIEKGLRKVLARMGISTMSSYRNSQIFETIGLDPAFATSSSKMLDTLSAGNRLNDLLRDCIACHAAGFGASEAEFRDAGLYRFRRNGEQHASSPELVRRMHRYIKSPTPQNQAALAALSKERKNVAVRDLLEIPSRAGCVPGGSGERSFAAQPLQHAGHVARSDFARSSPDSGDRHESPGRAQQYRRGRRRSAAFITSVRKPTTA